MTHNNVGYADRIVRVLLGLVIISLFFVFHGALRWISVIGAIPLITGMAGFCPMYSLVGFRTCDR